MRNKDISSTGLHIMAMTLMFIDHIGILIFPGSIILRSIGRLAFPIFAFLLVEGYRHTHNLGKYLLRLLAGAAIAEIPYNLMNSGDIFCPWHQNVMLTFILGLLLLTTVDKLRIRRFLPLLLAAFLGYAAGELCMVDYGGAGVLMVFCFYLYSNKPLPLLYCQIVLNWFVIGSMTLKLPMFEVPIQAFAILALVPIWMYHGRQGYHSKWFQAFCYGFYPVHMFVLWLIWVMILAA